MLMLVDQPTQPTSKEYITFKCGLCGDVQKRKFFNHLESATTQSRYTTKCLCSNCFRHIPSRIDANAKILDSVRSAACVAAGKKIKQLFSDPEYRDSRKHIHTAETISKISQSLKNKFVTDIEYSNTVLNSVNRRRLTKDDILARFKLAHNDDYDYSDMVYTTIDANVIIKCHIHGQFTQTSRNHAAGHGCPTCAVERSKMTHSDFVAKCAEIHNYKYDYSNTKYVGSMERIIYTCVKHGQIEQLANNHILGRGCRNCDASKQTSRGEDDIATYVGGLCSNVERNLLFDKTEFDIYVREKSFAIDYHGIYWHSENGSTLGHRRRLRHKTKADVAKANNIQLLQIYETEWLEHRSIVESMIARKLGIAVTIGARKCSIIKLTHNVAYNFFLANHLQGGRSAALYLGLEHNGILVACASFSKYKDDVYELIRFCNLVKHSVTGGLSRLLRHAMRYLDCKAIFTYVDRRYSISAESYIKSGFKLLGVTKPGYAYIKGARLYNRIKFQKHKLNKVLEIFDDTKSESENMFANGYRRIWDAGHHRLILERQ